MCVTQNQLKDQLASVFRRLGIRHRKVTRVIARPARLGEHVQTITSDGPESTDTAVDGDFLVENRTSARERYFVGANEFQAKYRLVRHLDDGWSVYAPDAASLIVAIAVNDAILGLFGTADQLRIEAPWGDTQPVNPGDYLVAPPDLSEIYRIGKKEFAETYEAVTDD